MWREEAAGAGRGGECPRVLRGPFEVPDAPGGAEKGVVVELVGEPLGGGLEAEGEGGEGREGDEGVGMGGVLSKGL